MILPLSTTTALILAVFFVLGLPLSTIASTRFRPALAVPIGLLLVPILVFVVWQGAAPEWRSTLFMGTGVVCGFGGLAVLIRRRHWVGAGVTTAALLLIVLHRIWPAYQLSKTAGFSAGNGDLPYYSVLARALVDYTPSSPGWIQGVDIQLDMFGNWGNGGFVGASLLAGSSFTSGLDPASVSLATLVAICLAMTLALFCLLRRATTLEPIALILVCFASVFSPFTIYLVSQSFILMLSAMSATIMLFWAVAESQRRASPRTVFAVAAVTILATGNLLLGYPSVGLPFIVAASLLAALLGVWPSARHRWPRVFRVQDSQFAPAKFHALNYWVVIAGVTLTIVALWGRVIQVYDDFALMTGTVAGWPLMVARPTSYFGAALSASWSPFDTLLALLAVVLVTAYIVNASSRNRFVPCTLALVGLLLGAYFSLQNGPESYTAWKASYFVTPVVVALVASSGLLALRRFKAFRRRPPLVRSFAASVAVCSIAVSILMIADDRILFMRANLDQLQASLDAAGNSPKVALEPLDQLWAAYLARETVQILVPSVHIARPLEPSTRPGVQIIVTYADDARTKGMCAGEEMGYSRNIEGSVFGLRTVQNESGLTCLN
jgi:hypothetical protein